MKDETGGELITSGYRTFIKVSELNEHWIDRMKALEGLPSPTGFKYTVRRFKYLFERKIDRIRIAAAKRIAGYDFEEI